MGTKKERICQPKCHRAVDWNEKAIQKVLDEVGYVFAGIKVDGMRCHIIYIDDELRIVTREGIEIKALENYRAGLHAMYIGRGIPRSLVLDCEVYIPGVTFEQGCGLLRRDEPLQAPYFPRFVILDNMPANNLLGQPGYGDYVPPQYKQRFDSILARWPAPVASLADSDKTLVCCESIAKCTSIEDIKHTYAVARNIGFEGLVIKDPRLAVRNGKVSGMWKVKPGCGADFAPGWEGDGKIIDYVWGDGDKLNAGKIVGFRLRFEDGSESNATGLTQEQMAEYTRTHIAAHCVASANPSPDPYRGRYAEVHAMERTANGSLRHPRFIRFRDLDYAPGVKA